MREILFRGIPYSTPSWVYGSLTKVKLHDENMVLVDEYRINQEVECISNGVKRFNYYVFTIRPETVGQYTGEIDVHEKKIFDGDRVKFTVFDYEDYDTQHEGVVRFNAGTWQIWSSADYEYFGSDGAFDLYWVLRQDDCLEVIGNIHESEVQK